MEMHSILKSRKGEAHIDTGVKIIIAVVIGSLILAGLFALFSLVIIPQLNDNVQDMMHYEEPATSFQYDAFECKVTSLQYSHDGATWRYATIPTELSEDAVVKQTYNSRTENSLAMALINDNDTIYVLISEDNGITWTIARSMGHINIGEKRVDYYLYQLESGKYKAEVRTYDGSTATSGWGTEYVSTDGRSWRMENLGIHYF